MTHATGSNTRGLRFFHDVAAACLVALVASGCKHDSVREQPSLRDVPAPSHFVTVQPVEVDEHGAAIVAQGNVAYDEDRVAAIIPPVQGRIVQLQAAAGDRVEQNAPLAILYSADVASAGAGLSEARITRVSAEQALARAERLLSEGAGSQREVIEARAVLAQAVAEERRAAGSLRAIGAPLSSAATYTLRAPMAGTIVRRSVRVGAEARPDASEPAFLIADLRRVWVLAYLHELQASAVHRGDSAEIVVPSVPGRTFQGSVDRVADAVDPNARAIVVRIAMDNTDAALKPDMFARVTIRTHATHIPIVPTTALVTNANGYAVFVQRPDGTFERRAVTTGAEMDHRTQILDGLHGGDRIVTEGALLLDATAEQVL
jgi:cobalt-zinc-cadmium efflux system membrane fusion protein